MFRDSKKLKEPLPRAILLLSAAVFMVSAALSFHWQFPPRVDAGGYNSIALNLAKGLGYIEDAKNAGHPELDDGIVRVGPGYEFFLAGIYTVTGYRIWVVWILQALLHALTVLVVYKLCKLIFPGAGEGGYMFAAFLFGLSPDLIFINSMLLSESLFLFLLSLSAYAFFRFWEAESKLAMLIPGVLWGLSILTRPTALLPFAAIFGILLWRRSFIKAVLFALIPFLLIAPWSYTMSKRYGSFVLTTTAGGYDLWVGNHLGATGGFDKPPEIQNLRDQYHSIILDKIGKEKYIEFLFGHPFAFLELQARKASIYFSLIRPTGFWLDLQFFPLDRIFLIASSAIWTALLFIAGLAGFAKVVQNFRNEPLQAKLFLAFAILQPLAIIPIIVDTRYRYALFPFLAVLGGYIFGHRKRLLHMAREKMFLYPAGFLLLATSYDIWYHAGEIGARLKQILFL